MLSADEKALTDRRTMPLWLSVETRLVIAQFLQWLSRTHQWRRIWLISPWLSEIRSPGVVSLSQIVKRLSDDRCTLYVVTRPPEAEWHWSVLQALRDSGRANVCLVPGLHTKLYCAETAPASFVMLGSANFTQRSLMNRELGVMMRASEEGAPVVRKLIQEAADIYRCSEGRKVWCKQQLGGA